MGSHHVARSVLLLDDLLYACKTIERSYILYCKITGPFAAVSYSSIEGRKCSLTNISFRRILWHTLTKYHQSTEQLPKKISAPLQESFKL